MLSKERSSQADSLRNVPLQGVGDTTDIIAMILLPVAVLMCAYALVVFLWRSGQIARKQVCGVAGCKASIRWTGRVADAINCCTCHAKIRSIGAYIRVLGAL